MHLPAVYFVDDDEDHTFFFQQTVDSLPGVIDGKFFYIGHDALESLQKGNSNLPCLNFLGLNAPKMNGLECLQQPNKHAVLSLTPVDLLTTSSHEREFQQCYSNGASLIAQPSGVCALVKAHPR